jgi:hypothetical protein
MTERVALLINDDTVNPWEWRVEFCALARKRLARLENEKLSLFELYLEVNDTVMEAHCYFAGLDEQAQRACARELRDVLAIATRIKDQARRWAKKELKRRGVNEDTWNEAVPQIEPRFVKVGIY